MKERRALFSKQSNEQKANFIKINLALQFIKQPNMTKEQREFVLDAISNVSADIYDKSDSEKVRRNQQKALEMQNKALKLFPSKEVGVFAEPLSSNADESVALVQKYEDLLTNGMKLRMKLAKEMSVSDRVDIWKVQLAYHLATGKFSKMQNDFILKMLTSLSPETFASRANLTKEEEAKILEDLESKIFNVFTKEEGFAIFMSIGIQKVVEDEPVAQRPEHPDCDCYAYCAGTPECTRVVCLTKNDNCDPWGDWVCRSVCV